MDLKKTSKDAQTSNQNFLLTLARKAEKITTAIYLTTDFIPETGKLKSELRTASLTLMDAIYATVNLSESGYRAHLADVLVMTERTRSLLKIAHLNGYVSAMNTRVIEDELQRLQSDLTALRSSVGLARGIAARQSREDVALPDEMFAGSDRTRLQLNDTTTTQQRRPNSAPVASSYQPQVEALKEPTKAFASTQSVRHRKQERQAIVMGLLRSQGEITMHDIKERITGCSDKTIQRLLADMIKQGLIERHGDKRWSTYKIAT